jgi:hypothetical protein
MGWRRARVTYDTEFMSAATDFVSDVIAFSEPLSSDCAGPEPNMLSYEIDNAAMWEASEQHRLDHEDDERYDFQPELAWQQTLLAPPSVASQRLQSPRPYATDAAGVHHANCRTNPGHWTPAFTSGLPAPAG